MPEPSEAAVGSAVAPLRKRRRPALSCEQCRKRKIKCDRSYPCTQCLQSKTAHCSYSPDSAGAIQHMKKGPSIYQDPLQVGAGLPTRSRNAPSASSSTYLPSDNTSPKLPLSDGTQTSWHSPTSEHLHDDSNSKALLERIQKLEEKLAIANNLNGTNEDTDLNGSQSQEDDLDTSQVIEQDVPESFFQMQNGPSFFGSQHRLRGTFEQKGKLKGTVSKTRFFGQSHWMYSFGTFDKISSLKVNTKNNTPEFTDTGTDINELMQKCKSMARAAKAGPHNQFLMNPNYRESVPPRPVSDKLMELYFRTHESTLRILHIPTFWKEYQQYWENPLAASTTFILKMLLAMSIGACFYQDDQNWHAQSLQWIFAGQAWLASPFEKGRLHISGLQIHCLVLNARLANAVAGDLVWISAGSLLRTAFQMGFHRDPKHLPRMLPLHAELRRRLWATIIELNTQGALDSGMPPLLHLDDFDTEPPSNFDDADLDEYMTVLPEPKPRNVYTQSSLQIMLLESLPTRLKIVSYANNFRSEPSYEEILALGSTMTKSLREHNTFINTVNTTYLDPEMQDPRGQTPKHYVNRLYRNGLDLCQRRFLLSLHRPFAAKAQNDLRYYFSRKVCLDCAMTMLSYPSSDPGDQSIEPGKQDDFTRLKTMSGGFQKGLLVHAAMVIFAELLSQIDEESTFTEQSRAAREPLKQALRDIVDLSALRIMHAENNIKGHLFISVVLAQVEAMELGIPPERMVLEAARNSAELCMELLSKRIPVTVSDDDYARHVENGSAADGAGIQQAPTAQDFGFDTMMQDWTMDSQYFNMPDSWLISGWEDNQPWALQV